VNYGAAKRLITYGLEDKALKKPDHRRNLISLVLVQQGLPYRMEEVLLISTPDTKIIHLQPETFGLALPRLLIVRIYTGVILNILALAVGLPPGSSNTQTVTHKSLHI
jgi:hypothetical protein